jgi:hypothetical protein
MINTHLMKECIYIFLRNINRINCEAVFSSMQPRSMTDFYKQFIVGNIPQMCKKVAMPQYSV